MSDLTIPTRYLTSLNQHLRKHGLSQTVVSITLPRHGEPGYVQLCYAMESDLGMLAQFVRTLRGATVSFGGFSKTNERLVHMKALGAMGDGTATEVRAIVEGDEFDLLCANTPVVQGANIPVDLLLSLVSADAAEARGVTALAGQVSA